MRNSERFEEDEQPRTRPDVHVQCIGIGEIEGGKERAFDPILFSRLLKVICSTDDLLLLQIRISSLLAAIARTPTWTYGGEY